MPSESQFHFFEVRSPGRRIDRERLTVLRTHVRRAIARKKKTQPIDYTLKIVTPEDVEKKSRKAIRTAAKRNARKKPNFKPQQENRNPLVNCKEKSLERSIAPALALHHPFAICAANVVDMDVGRLDQLFKSDAFRTVGEPFFDTSQVDSNRAIGNVFPDGLESPSFLYALTYSMLQVFNRDRWTVETLHVRGKMISTLNQHLSTVEQPSAALVGAVMILTAAAGRFDDMNAYATHSAGLVRLLELCKWQKSQSGLTPAASRAVFWLDLFSSICHSAPRRVSHHSLPNQPIWSRTSLPKPVNTCSLPVGFSRHQSLIPDDLLDCLQDTFELQSKMKDPAYRKDYMLLDNMQASIESRLSFQGRACQCFGDDAEMIRLAAFICCYCCWTDTWNSNVVPSKVARLLLNRLEDAFGITSPKEAPKWETLNKRWQGRGDLLLWLVFVGAMVARDKEFVTGLREGYGRVILIISDWVSGDDTRKMWSSRMLRAVREDFLYCDVWMEKRLWSREWFVLEITFGLAS